MASLGVVGAARVLDGSPASAIVACAENLRAELVVVGSRGRTGLARMVLGSVAEGVIRNASCSVLAVRL
jgi:nucleotide-binding universal stress UspA family protein